MNGFDRSVGLQVTLHNVKINREEFNKRILLQYRNDNNDTTREEFNEIMRKHLIQGQNGIHCKKYVTITVSAPNYAAAESRFANFETHLFSCAGKLGTIAIPLKANERVRILTDIFRGVDTVLPFVDRSGFIQRFEKTLCCPDYFEFKKDYFMFNDKYVRCMFIRDYNSSVHDDIFKDFIETNQSMIVTKNVGFIDTAN